MDAMDMLFGTIGGLGLFLFGMGMLSDGLKAAAGDRLRSLLAKITKWPLMAMLVGAGVTCLVQSSSATTVIVIGLVNAGMLTLRQAICVVLGANIGTTFTAWLIAGMSVFKITSYALPAVGLGFLLHVFGRRARTRHWGQILLGFGILFIGISFMKEAFAPIRKDQGVQALLISLGDQPILAVLAGTIITMLVQSSSASIAMIQTLAFAGAFGTDWDVVLRVTIPFVLGDNIGTTITAQLAALRTNLSARRTAMAHTLFNVLGVAIVLPLVYVGWYLGIVKAISPVGLTQNTVMLHIALAHSTFNVVAALIVLPLAGVLESLVLKVLPSKPGQREIPTVTLERNLLDTPAVAMIQARKEIVRMAATARSALEDAIAVMCRDDRSRARKAVEKEEAVDNFQTEITRYLVELSQRELSPKMANELPVLLHSVNDLERVGDHATNIMEDGVRKLDHGYAFSEPAAAEIDRMYMEVNQMFQDVLVAVADYDINIARRALEHETILNKMQVDLRGAHVDRLTAGGCDPMVGLIFVDLVDNFEKIGDHLANVAQGIIGGLQWRLEDTDKTPPPPDQTEPPQA